MWLSHIYESLPTSTPLLENTPADWVKAGTTTDTEKTKN